MVKPQIRRIEEFESVRENTSKYPGDITDYSFVSDSELVYPITFPDNDVMGAMVETTDGPVILDNWLRAHGVPGLDERFPVRAYAANRNPRVSAPDNKMGEHGQPIVPTFVGKSEGLAVVYQNAGRFGYMYGDAYVDPAASMDEAITLLSLKDGSFEGSQLQVMDKSEPNYTRRFDSELFTLPTGQTVPSTMIYAGTANMFHSNKHNGPIGIAEIPFTSEMTRLSQEQMLDLLVEELGLESRGITSGVHFRETAGEEWLKWKHDNPGTAKNPEGGIVQYVQSAIADGHSKPSDTSLAFKELAPVEPEAKYTLKELVRK